MINTLRTKEIFIDKKEYLESLIKELLKKKVNNLL